ncbi:PEP/pyruvate-binding domain-containing protein [Desulforhabdus amnigena]|uniref:Phosphoenolpyruvate synthase/pyruvate phosphate dikinase n=1 Tax=Desulforhabdus amnigena TaxID=40218 RepID=A0A9W6FWL7_9BACT|nr:PEP/pyruvate-binding domain-containing protein [Desulforhabdus amnigena]GLI36189.1 phosphoenolpyruvate synthase/pyruvate phosphate dikinase [Desulforhabdus amnigena]
MNNLLELDRIQSDALTKNLDLTNVKVEVPPHFEILVEAVKGYAGKEQQARELLLEYHHLYRNWQFVIQETWRYATSNLRLYRNHPLNGMVVYLLSHILLGALRQSERSEIRNLAADHLLAFWLKISEEMSEEISRPVPAGVSLEIMDQAVPDITACHQGIPRFFLRELSQLDERPFEHLMRSYYQPKKLAKRLLKIWTETASFLELRALMQRLTEETYHFWLLREDPCEWLNQQGQSSCAAAPWVNLCSFVSHHQFQVRLQMLKTEIEREKDHREAVAKLTELPDFHEIVRHYFKLPEELKRYETADDGTHLSMLMRLKIMETRGLEGIHEETLREINFDIARIIRQEPAEGLQNFLNRIFDVLEVCMKNYPEAALQIVRTIGVEVIHTGIPSLIDPFLKRIICMGFQTPKLGGISEHWQRDVNPAHLPNIRIWLEIIKKNPARTKMLLSALIVNLSLGGIYIRDTDLFQKDVSQLLHAPIRTAYNLIKQLAKLFPVYFNQIGAEGQLRAVSTDVDELTGRSDRLIHFLRKQSHVESNNVVVSFIEAIINFWRTLDKSKLKELVPAEIYSEIVTSGPLVDEVHRIFTLIFESKTIHHVKDLLDLSEEDALSLIQQVPDLSDRERKRAFLIIQLYQLLHEKYALSFKDIHIHLQRAANLGLPDPTHLLEALEYPDPGMKLEAILDYLMELKEVIHTPSELHIQENIYYKRHIAVDIPSMYGTYNEHKFDALGLTFRLENLANVLFEEIIFSFNLSFITRATFFRIAKFLPLFIKALAIDGITSNRLELQTELFLKSLEVRRFSHSQFMDIFRGFSEAIKQIIQTNYHSVHEANLDLVIKQLGPENLLPRYQREGHAESQAERNQRVSESFLRDLIARTFGLQYFDHFIGSILTTLATQREVLSTDKLDLLLSYDPEKTISLVYKPNPKTYDLIHMGNKGYNLAKLYSIGIKVPPAFVITTEYFRCRSVITDFAQAREDFEERVMNHITKLEEETGRGFGCPGNALLLSVRSGAAVSMPGMMNTFLNVGINEQVVEGLIRQTGQSWFAWDNYRRFIQSWGMSFGMQRDEFDAIMAYYKKVHGRLVKREFKPEEIRELALAYRKKLEEHHIDFSDSPKEQLFTAIGQVMESWYSEKAKTYREIMMLSENWGTAVAIQAMVFGNLDNRSGAGVMFTHNPKTSEDEIDPVGDFTLGNQGEDVVGGLVKTLPLSEKQRLAEGEREEYSLEKLFPRVYQRLFDIARELVSRRSWAPQEIEFTFQGDGEEGVYILQSRNMAPRVRRLYPVFKPSAELQQMHIGSGIGVSGGALSGLVAFDLDSIVRLRKEHLNQPIILIRADTVPDDIGEISISDGILTGKGGATSHAAIVAHRLGKTCVVGLSKMKVWEKEKKCIITSPSQTEHIIHTGDSIAIDGRSGAVYMGYHETIQVDVLN